MEENGKIPCLITSDAEIDKSIRAAVEAGEQILNQKYLSKGEYISMCLANFIFALANGLTKTYLLVFYLSVLGIDAAAVALMFLITKIFDALNDPIMGTIIDKTRSKWGKMRPYMLFSSIPLGLVVIMMFLPVKDFSRAGMIFWMYFTYVLFDIASTVMGVPLNGIPAVASPNAEETRKLISYSRIAGSIGGEGSQLFVTIFLALSKQDYKFSIVLTAVIIGIVSIVALPFCALKTKERIKPSEESPRMLEGFIYMFKNKQFLPLIISNILLGLRSLVASSIVYVAAYVFGKGSLQLFFALPGAVASMLGMFATPMLLRKMDSKRLFIVSSFAHSILLVLVWAVGVHTWWLTAALMFFAMFPVGILSATPALMATDTLDYWEDKTGVRQEGITFSVLSLAGKVSNALKDFTLSYLLVFFLFSSSLPFLNNHMAGQSQFTTDGIFMIYTLIPAALNLICLIPLKWYNLNRKKMHEIQLNLSEKRLAGGTLDISDAEGAVAEEVAA